MDTVSEKKRSYIMKAVKSKGTKIELLLRKALSKEGHRYKINCDELIGKPDIVFEKNKLAIFVDSCFWHGCQYHCRIPKTNRRYWLNKIKRNKKRDREVNKWYVTNRWILLRFWEHSAVKDIKNCLTKIGAVLIKSSQDNQKYKSRYNN